MNPNELEHWVSLAETTLERLVAFDSRTTGPEDITVWATALSEVRASREEALAAVKALCLGEPGQWVTAAHVLAHIRKSRKTNGRWIVERAALPHINPDNAAAYIEAMRDAANAIPQGPRRLALPPSQYERVEDAQVAVNRSGAARVRQALEAAKARKTQPHTTTPSPLEGELLPREGAS